MIDILIKSHTKNMIFSYFFIMNIPLILRKLPQKWNKLIDNLFGDITSSRLTTVLNYVLFRYRIWWWILFYWLPGIMNRTEFNIVLSREPPRTPPSVIHSHIPVPRISTTFKAQERCPPKRRGSFEKLVRGTTVAAQRASFEKLDASVQPKPRNNNLSTSSIEVRNLEEKSTSVNNYKTNDLVKLNRSNSFLENKWKNRYEDSEKKRKFLLQKSETGNYTNLIDTD